jgi:type III secretion system TyeA family effector delivery regulator
MALNEQKRLAITRNILRAVQGSSVGLSQVEGILQDFELPMGDVESRIFILSRLAELIRELSMKTFRSDEQRLEALDTIQEALDHYIDVEDVIVDEVP